MAKYDHHKQAPAGSSATYGDPSTIKGTLANADNAAYLCAEYSQSRQAVLYATVLRLSRYAGRSDMGGKGEAYKMPGHISPGEMRDTDGIFSFLHKCDFVRHLLCLSRLGIDRDRPEHKAPLELLTSWLVMTFHGGYNAGYTAAYNDQQKVCTEKSKKAAEAYEKGFKEGVEALRKGLRDGQYRKLLHL